VAGVFKGELFIGKNLADFKAVLKKLLVQLQEICYPTCAKYFTSLIFKSSVQIKNLLTLSS
jgi:hypothetical protein